MTQRHYVEFNTKPKVVFDKSEQEWVASLKGTVKDPYSPDDIIDIDFEVTAVARADTKKQACIQLLEAIDTDVNVTIDRLSQHGR